MQIQTTVSSTSPLASSQQNTTGEWMSEKWSSNNIFFVALELSQYIAIFPYEAQQDDELSFPADAVLEILEEVNASGWFKARLGDQVGLIPSTYVQPIETHNQCK